MLIRAGVFLWGLMIPGWVAAQGVGGKPGFYERKAEGWFWYQEKPPEPEITTRPVTPSTETVSAADPPSLSAAWLRENLPKYKDAAWDHPTIDNLQAFLYLQRYAIDRSQEFADSAELAVVGDWHLDETARRPEAGFAARVVDHQAGIAKQHLIKTLAQQCGLFFFFKSNCQHSQLQADIVQVLQRRAGFTVVPISLDGLGLPDGTFSHFKVDSGHAELLGAQSTPALFLASVDGDFSSVGYGVMSLPELEHRLLVAARRKQWITTEQFNSTRPILNGHNILSQPNQSSATTPALPIPPAELVSLLRDASNP